MPDYSNARRALLKAREAVRSADLAIGRVNMPPSMAPSSVARQIAAVEEDLRAALADCQNARDALRPKLVCV